MLVDLCKQPIVGKVIEGECGLKIASMCYVSQHAFIAVSGRD
jgi:hypothetical protein